MTPLTVLATSALELLAERDADDGAAVAAAAASADMLSNQPPQR